MKDNMRKLLDFVVRKSKIIFPVVVIAAVAVTVLVALKANGVKAEQVEKLSGDAQPSTEAPGEALEPKYEEISLVLNEDSAIHSVVATYYNAMALGDLDTLIAICDTIAEDDLIRIQETSKYLVSYPVLDIYTKPGYEEDSTIAYVYYKVVFTGKEAEYPGYQTLYICTDEQGELYIKRDGFSDEVQDYITAMSIQDDVVDLNNRVTVEYNELLVEQPDLWAYLKELDKEVKKVTGVMLAQQVSGEAVAANGDGSDSQEGDEGEAAAPEAGGEPEGQTPQELYATATTTVNVRNSDSENADKLGKVSGGTKLQVLEQKVNGWTKVLFEGKEGFIKSEFLQVAESAAESEVIGTVKATTNINVRASGSETAEKLGVLAGGDTAELIARENGWCKIKYNGQIGYVKADYVE